MKHFAIYFTHVLKFARHLTFLVSVHNNAIYVKYMLIFKAATPWAIQSIGSWAIIWLPQYDCLDITAPVSVHLPWRKWLNVPCAKQQQNTTKHDTCM